MNNLDSERQAIMNDNSIGINQKIVSLQSLHHKNQSSAYSTIQISEMNKRVENAKKEAIESRMQEAQDRIDTINDQIELENIQESFSQTLESELNHESCNDRESIG